MVRHLAPTSTYKVFIILSVLCLLVACSAPNRAPVDDRGTKINNGINYHYVSQGETLYSIAWRYGVHYATLASWNGIATPYTIYPGQKLSLYPTGATPKSKPQSSRVVQKTPTPNATQRSKTATRKVTKPTPPTVYSKNLKWRWPANGKLVSLYSPSKGLNQGVDIAGRLGEPVIAAASGVVVYAGNGLRGYGNLLILKHNERFLSAYAHNRKLLVKEQEVIKAGQKIAEIGSSGTDKNKLHFEIRRDGKPVDPLRYLPKR